MPLFYKQSSLDGTVSIERCTENVPQDKKFYIIQEGNIVCTFSSLKKAQARFNELKPVVKQTTDKVDRDKRISNEIIEQTAYAKEQYWHNSYKYRGKK